MKIYRMSIDFSSKHEMVAFFHDLRNQSVEWLSGGVGLREMDALDTSDLVKGFLVRKRRPEDGYAWADDEL